MLKNNLDFKHNETIIKKGLTTLGYFRVLGIIGQSEEPLDNKQIKANFEKIYGQSNSPWNKYKYEILKELSPMSEKVANKLLFIWEDFKILEIAELEEKCHQILQQINQAFDFKIDNRLNEDYIVLMDGDSLKASNKWIIIQQNDKNSKTFNPYFDEDILIMIYDKLYDKSQCQIFPILTIKKKGKIYVYSKSYTYLERRQFLNTTTIKRISFLYIPGQKSEKDEKNNLPRTHQLLKEIFDKGESFSIDNDTYLREWFSNHYAHSKNENLPNNEKFSQKHDYMKFIREHSDELNRITGDRQYFSYTLNFKGLLLFLILYGSIKKSKSEKLLFDKVLSNPSIVKIAPFLKYLNEFEELGFKGKELIVTIDEELRNQLHLDIPDGNFLLERAIERYYKEFQKYILPKQSPSYVSLINDYQKNMISLLKDFIIDKHTIFGFSLKEHN